MQQKSFKITDEDEKEFYSKFLDLKWSRKIKDESSLIRLAIREFVQNHHVEATEAQNSKTPDLFADPESIREYLLLLAKTPEIKKLTKQLMTWSKIHNEVAKKVWN